MQDQVAKFSAMALAAGPQDPPANLDAAIQQQDGVEQGIEHEQEVHERSSSNEEASTSGQNPRYLLPTHVLPKQPLQGEHLPYCYAGRKVLQSLHRLCDDPPGCGDSAWNLDELDTGSL